MTRQLPRQLPGNKLAHSATAPALLTVSKSTNMLRELIDTLPLERAPKKLQSVETLKRLRDRGGSIEHSRVNDISDPKSHAWASNPEAADIIGTIEPIFIPVEFFDDPAYEPWPLHEWLSKGEKNSEGFVEGYSRWYEMDGSWKWRLVNVLDYVEESKRFLVAWSHNGKKKYVPRLNLRFVGEDEVTFEKRYNDAEQRRDTAEAAARHKATIDVLMDEIDLPKVVVPSEIFIGIFSRANVDIEAPMSRTFAKSIAKLSEEVRLEYILIMNRLHAGAIADVPVPGRPTEAVGMPALPFESLAIRILRHGGIAEWKSACGFSEAASDSFQSSMDKVRTFHPSANYHVLKTIQKLRNEIIFRVEKMDVLYGSLTKWKPNAAFNHAFFILLPHDKKGTHPFRAYEDLESDETKNGLIDKGFPCTLEHFQQTQRLQIELFEKTAIPHAQKLMDEIVFDEFSVACDKLQLKLSTYESCLHLQRTKRSAPKAVPPSIPDGVLEPKELTHMRSPFASIKDIPKGFFANREASIHASNMYRGPFRRALIFVKSYVSGYFAGLYYSWVRECIGFICTV